MKNKLDNLVKQFETVDFIKDDPIQFPHRFSDKPDVEIAGFLASVLAYGNRKVFIKKLNELFDIMQNAPHDFVLNFKSSKRGMLGDFNYRFYKTDFFECFFDALQKTYKNDGGLEVLFSKGKVHERFSMLPNPKNGSAMKRENMFLRWMIRTGPVDLGIWDFKEKSELLIPLDVHVGNVSRGLGLLGRSANDFKAVVELTTKLKQFDPVDPVKYDFALFGAGVSGAQVP